MRRFRRIWVIAAAIAALSLPGVARADTVTGLERPRRQRARRRAAAADDGVVHMAMVRGTMYDAVNGIDRSHRAYLVLPTARHGTRWTQRPRRPRIACSSASSPAQQSVLEPLYEASLAAVPDGQSKDGGIAAAKRRPLR